MRDPPRSTGFSLIELLIVLSLMGILAGLVLPDANPNIREQLRSVSQIVATDLAYGRSLALTNNSHYRFTFDVEENQYVLEHSGSSGALDNLPDSPFRRPEDPSDQHVVDLDDLPSVTVPVRIVAVYATGSGSQSVEDLEFGPLGETTRSDETVVWLATGHAAGTRYTTLHVNPVTGLATVGPYGGRGPEE